MWWQVSRALCFWLWARRQSKIPYLRLCNKSEQYAITTDQSFCCTSTLNVQQTPFLSFSTAQHVWLVVKAVVAEKHCYDTGASAVIRSTSKSLVLVMRSDCQGQLRLKLLRRQSPSCRCRSCSELRSGRTPSWWVTDQSACAERCSAHSVYHHEGILHVHWGPGSGHDLLRGCTSFPAICPVAPFHSLVPKL